MAPFDYSSSRTRAPLAALTSCTNCDIRNLTFCTGLQPDELHRLQTLTTHLSVGPGQTILREGDDAEYIYNVTGGTVKLFKLMPDGRRQITGFLFDGAFLGVFQDDTYAYSAESVTQVMLCRFPKKRLEALMDDAPGVRKRLLGIMVEKLAVAQEQMLLLGRKTALEKVSSFLLMLSNDALMRGQPEHLLSVPMNRSDIADYLGLTIETVSRTLTQLKKSGIIRIPDSSHIFLEDKERLFDIAEGDGD